MKMWLFPAWVGILHFVNDMTSLFFPKLVLYLRVNVKVPTEEKLQVGKTKLLVLW